jgi:hypothetical protein
VTNPNACRHCGIDKREHMQQWKPPVGWHQWTPPTQEQIKARMLARHAERNEAPMPTTPAVTAPHQLTVAYAPEGRITSWDHPDNCPDGEHCDILRRTRRMGLYDMSELGEGRPEGTYLLGRFGFHGLVLVDNDGKILPDVPQDTTTT